jgi:hypothetical protein
MGLFDPGLFLSCCEEFGVRTLRDISRVLRGLLQTFLCIEILGLCMNSFRWDFPERISVIQLHIQVDLYYIKINEN